MDIQNIQRDCGCCYTPVGAGVVVFTRRCAAHAVMCRSLEQWELEPPFSSDPPTAT